MILKSKNDNTQDKRLDFKQLALNLGISKELIQHHKFMVDFESAIQSICNSSSKEEIKNFCKHIFYFDWSDFEFENESIYQKVLSEIKNSRYFLDTNEKNAFIDKHMVCPVKTSINTALFVDEEGKVYIQKIVVGPDPGSEEYTYTLDYYRTLTQVNSYSSEQGNLVIISYNERQNKNKEIEYAETSEYIYNKENEIISINHPKNNIGRILKYR